MRFIMKEEVSGSLISLGIKIPIISKVLILSYILL